MEGSRLVNLERKCRFRGGVVGIRERRHDQNTNLLFETYVVHSYGVWQVSKDSALEER